MGKRVKIALNYTYNENWIGGTYYIENLIAALNNLKDDDKPLIYIISTNENYSRLKKSLFYPYLKAHKQYDDRFILWRALNKICAKFLKSEILKKNLNVDAIFPFAQPVSFLTTIKRLYWIPDFQEYYLPHFFSEEEISIRKESQNIIVKNGKSLILSSKNSSEHFNEIYPLSNVKTYVLPFAVTLSDYSDINFNKIKTDFNLVDEYFVCSNQFWIHKDHKTLIEAVYLLKQKGIKKTVYLTGKTEDYRFPGYFKEITDLIDSYQLADQVILLGFIDRKIQLSIVEHSVAIIQPSLFEGWSTVIEDAKALSKYIIASDINIHKEQLKIYSSLLFKKGNPADLAEKIKLCHDNKLTNQITYNYRKDITQFGETFMKIIKTL